MSRYFFRFVSPTRLTGSSWGTHQKIEQKIIKINFPSEDSQMMVFDKRIEKEGLFLHYGLGFDVEVSAVNKEVAKTSAENLVINILSLICFLEACYADTPFNILSYKVAEKDLWLEEYSALVTDKSYRPRETSLRPINLDRLNDFMKKMMEVNIEARSAIAIDNSMHWFWRALGARDLKDRFINLWIGLEFLEEPLKKKFGLSTGSAKKQPTCSECKKEFSTICTNCGKDYYYIGNVGQTGIKELEKKISEKIMKFNELHSFRSQLFHSSTRVKPKTPDDFKGAIHSARVLLNYAIFELLGFDPKYAAPMAGMNMRVISLPTLLEFKGRVKVKKSLTIDDIEKQPSIQGEYKFEYKIEDNDELVQLVDVEHTFDGAFETGQVEKIVKEDSSHNTKDVWDREKKKEAK